MPTAISQATDDEIEHQAKAKHQDGLHDDPHDGVEADLVGR
jgi:hypothetical protein